MYIATPIETSESLWLGGIHDLPPGAERGAQGEGPPGQGEEAAAAWPLGLWAWLGDVGIIFGPSHWRTG